MYGAGFLGRKVHDDFRTMVIWYYEIIIINPKDKTYILLPTRDKSVRIYL